jgi:arylsulfatase A-like enzyme
MRRSGLFLCLVAFFATVGSAQAARLPNIVLIITDDQPAGTMSVMPRTVRKFATRGTTYSQAYVTTPFCCPSRASIFSGKYAHNHGIFGNDGAGFDATQTWQRHLHDAGYYTGIIGKYLNGVPTSDAPYFDYKYDYLSDAKDEPGRWLRAAKGFVAQAETQDQRPWALVIATYSPHFPWTVRPKSPEPIPPFNPDPAYGEENLDDKSAAVQAAAAGSWNPDKVPQRQYPGQMLELQATDRKVRRLFQALRAAGEGGARTLSFYIADNGMLQGAHRLYAKQWPYLGAAHVPFFMRWPRHVAQGVTENGLVANIDIAPTIFAATGISPDYPVDGLSLFGSPHDALLLEFPATDVSPPWSAYLDPTRHYVEWADGFVEDYDLTADASEVTASNSPDPASANWLDIARACVGSSCP